MRRVSIEMVRGMTALMAAAVTMCVLASASVRAQDQAAAPVAAPAPPPIVEHVAGSAGHVWIVRRADPAADDFEVLHRSSADEKGVIYREMAGRGKLTHVAASGASLWLLYDDRSVQALRFTAATRSVPRAVQLSQRQPLPAGGMVEGWVAGEAGPAALIRHADATPDPDEPPAATEASAQRPESSDAPPPAAPLASLRLLALEPGGWRDVALPATIRPEMVRAIAVRAGQRYVLVSDHRPTQALTVHDQHQDAWVDRAYASAMNDATQFVAVGDDLFMVQETRATIRWRLVPHKLHQGQTRMLGATVVTKHVDRWWAIAGDEALALVAVDASGTIELAERRIDDASMGSATASPLAVRTPPAVLPQPLSFFVMAAMILGMVLLLGGPRREPDFPVMVPRGTRPLVAARALAAAIDFLPALAISMILHRILNPLDIIDRWRADPDAWHAMRPALTTLAVYFGHTTVTELLTASTFGKLLFNLRVVSMTGLRPNIWQVLGRNLFKAVEIMPPFVLLMVPLLNRYHQRMGDMIARTLVVGPDPDAERRRKQEERELFGDDEDDDTPDPSSRP